jgi:hypothetical protein
MGDNLLQQLKDTSQGKELYIVEEDLNLKFEALGVNPDCCFQKGKYRQMQKKKKKTNYKTFFYTYLA